MEGDAFEGFAVKIMKATVGFIPPGVLQPIIRCWHAVDEFQHHFDRTRDAGHHVPLLVSVDDMEVEVG
jgi:hypothetical protein